MLERLTFKTQSRSIVCNKQHADYVVGSNQFCLGAERGGVESHDTFRPSERRTALKYSIAITVTATQHYQA